MTRVCPRGHLVAEDDLRTCPHCGGSLPATGVRAGSLAPGADATGQSVDVPKTVPFLIAAVLVAVFGGLLAYAARRGPAEVFSWVLIAGAVVLAGVAFADLAKRRRP